MYVYFCKKILGLLPKLKNYLQVISAGENKPANQYIIFLI